MCYGGKYGGPLQDFAVHTAVANGTTNLLPANMQPNGGTAGAGAVPGQVPLRGVTDPGPASVAARVSRAPSSSPFTIPSAAVSAPAGSGLNIPV